MEKPEVKLSPMSLYFTVALHPLVVQLARQAGSSGKPPTMEFRHLLPALPPALPSHTQRTYSEGDSHFSV